MSGTYVTDTGFVKKTLVEIKEELEDDYKTAFGDDIDLDSEGVFGQQIGIQAKTMADAWDALEEIYTARNPQEATGTSLDYISSENNIVRQDATPTTLLNVILYGAEGVVVPAESTIRNELILEYVFYLALLLLHQGSNGEGVQ